jgi:hypothetical protein
MKALAQWKKWRYRMQGDRQRGLEKSPAQELVAVRLSRPKEARKRKNLQLALHAWLWAALLKTTVMCKAWRRCTTLLRILLELVQPLATLASPRAKYLIPIPVPVQYRLSQCLE